MYSTPRALLHIADQTAILVEGQASLAITLAADGQLLLAIALAGAHCASGQ